MVIPVEKKTHYLTSSKKKYYYYNFLREIKNYIHGGICGVGDQMGGKEINVDSVQRYSSSSQAFLYKYFSIKAPKTASLFERGELQLYERVPA